MRAKIILSLVAAVTVLTGCSGQDEPPTPETLASLRVLTEECPEAVDECGSVLSIDSKGNWTLDESEGFLPEVSLIRVKEGVRDTALAESPDTQADCALKTGGVESIYSWSSQEKTYQVRSCDKDIPSDDPLVQVLQNLWTDLNNAQEDL